MKKFLLLAAFGVAGLVSAKGKPVETKFDVEVKGAEVKLESNNIVKKTFITYNYVNGSLASCTIAYHMYEYNNNGQLVGSTKTSYEASGSICEGVEGGVKIHIFRYNNGFE